MPGRMIQVRSGGVGTGGASGQPDQQFMVLRTSMREKIFEFLGRKQSPAEWRRRLPELARRLEEILHGKYPNKYDYYNMMEAPIAPELQFAIRTLSAQNQRNPQVERQIPPSSSSDLVGGSGVATGGANGQPCHQPEPVEDTAGLAALGTDQQFVMLRTAMREKIFEYIGRRQSSAEWRRRLPELAKRLEEILYTKFPNKNDYYNMMKGPVEPQLQFAIRTLAAQNQQNQRNQQVERQTPSSSSSNLDMNHDVPSEQFASPQADMQNNNADEHNRTE